MSKKCPRGPPGAPPSAPLPGSSSALLPLRCTLDHRQRAVACPSSWRFGTARSHAPTAVITGCWSCKLQQGRPSMGSCGLVAPNPCHRFSKSMPWNFELFRRMHVHNVSWRAAKFEEILMHFAGARSRGVIVAVLRQLLAGVGLGGRRWVGVPGAVLVPARACPPSLITMACLLAGGVGCWWRVGCGRGAARVAAQLRAWGRKIGQRGENRERAPFATFVLFCLILTPPPPSERTFAETICPQFFRAKW